jgi:hypothetical protein
MIIRFRTGSKIALCWIRALGGGNGSVVHCPSVVSTAARTGSGADRAHTSPSRRRKTGPRAMFARVQFQRMSGLS